MEIFEKYRKFVVALLGAAALTAFQAVSAIIQANDGTLTGLSVAFVALSVLSAVAALASTFQFDGDAPSMWQSAKFWANVAHVGLQGILAALGTGFDGLNAITIAQWVGVVIAVLQAAGVGVIPNTDVAQPTKPVDLSDAAIAALAAAFQAQQRKGGTAIPTTPSDPGAPAAGTQPSLGN